MFHYTNLLLFVLLADWIYEKAECFCFKCFCNIKKKFFYLFPFFFFFLSFFFFIPEENSVNTVKKNDNPMLQYQANMADVQNFPAIP